MSDDKNIIPINIEFTIPLPDGRRLKRAAWCYVLRGESAVMIDAGVAGAWPRIQRTLAEAAFSDDAIEHLCFTHAHPDHIGAARSILAAKKRTTYAHRDAAGWIENTELQKKERPVPGFDTLVEGPVRIDQTLEDGETLEFGEMSLSAMETPGHAAGHLAFYCPQMNALFSGDGLPEPNAMPIYTNLAASIHSIRRMRAVDAAALYSSWEKPIFGRPAIEARFAAALDWLQTVHHAVRAVADSADDILEITQRSMAALGLPPAAANSLTAATVRTHMNWLDVENIAAIENERENL